jgi:hypothetical protein
MSLTRFADWLIIRVSSRRAPDFVIGGNNNPYMLRWWLTPWSGKYRDIADGDKTLLQHLVSKLPGCYLHLILRSDDDRALHDHPWRNCSIVLRGSYLEHTIAAGGVHQRARRSAGDIVWRRARDAHRIEIDSGACWSLFLTGARVRHWGFHCPSGWVHWRIFTNPADGGKTIGRGCAS